MRVVAAACVLVLLVFSAVPSTSGAPEAAPEPASGPAAEDEALDLEAPASNIPFYDPEWQVGHWWKYVMDARQAAINLDGVVTMKADSNSTVTIDNQTYNSLRFVNTGNGTAKGNIGGFPFDGTWTITGSLHVGRNGTDELQSEQLLVAQNTNPPATYSSYAIANYTPALKVYQWPLMNGTTWTWTGKTTQYNWTKVQSPQGDQWIARPNSTTVNGTRNFRSVGAVYKTVPAGTFLTLHVEEFRRARQPVFGAADHFYSDAPGNAVQFEFAGQNNTIGGYLNLSSTNYQMKQPKYGSIGGKVADEAGGALKGAKITAKDSKGSTATVFADAAGNYVLTSLTPDSYQLTANLSTYLDGTGGGAVAAGKHTTVDFVLKKPTGWISVEAKDDKAAVLQGVKVDFKGPWTQSNTTGADGKVRVKLHVGLYDVTATLSGHKSANQTGVEVKLGLETQVSLTLAKIRGSIGGVVKDASSQEPLAGATVTVRSGSTVVATATTDAAGAYKIENLDPASYAVTAEIEGYKNLSVPVQVRGGQESKQNFVLQKVPPPAQKGGDNTPLFAGIGLAAIAVVALLALLMMRSKKKKQQESQQQRHQQQQQWPKQ